MKKFALTFSSGLLVGAVATFIFLGLTTLQYDDYFIIGARHQIFIASELRANRERELQNRVEANLPEIVLAIHHDSRLRKADDGQSVLLQIKDFYELNSLPVPSEISGILNEVPRKH